MSLREVLVGLIFEYARHMGHADLLRERIDGRIGQGHCIGPSLTARSYLPGPPEVRGSTRAIRTDPVSTRSSHNSLVAGVHRAVLRLLCVQRVPAYHRRSFST